MKFAHFGIADNGVSILVVPSYYSVGTTVGEGGVFMGGIVAER